MKLALTKDSLPFDFRRNVLTIPFSWRLHLYALFPSLPPHPPLLPLTLPFQPAFQGFNRNFPVGRGPSSARTNKKSEPTRFVATQLSKALKYQPFSSV